MMRKATSFGDNFNIFLVEKDLRTFTEAMISRDARLQKEAINNELETILSNHV